MPNLLILDSRARDCFHSFGVSWLNANWKRVESAAFVIALLKQQGMADAIMRACARRLAADYGSWVEHLHHLTSIQRRALSIRSVKVHAAQTSRKCLHNYIGTEHLMFACLTIDATLLNDCVPNIAQEYWMELKAWCREVNNDHHTTAQCELRWPKWAPKCILRVDDFPTTLADDAQLIVDSMALMTKKDLLKLPHVRYALSLQPQNVAEFRRRLVEYFVDEHIGSA